MAQEPKFHRVDDLFKAAKRYSKSTEYYNLINFCKRMRHLGPYNAMLANIQMPGARFLLTADEWRRYNRIVKDTAHPIVILMPFSECPISVSTFSWINRPDPIFTIAQNKATEAHYQGACIFNTNNEIITTTLGNLYLISHSDVIGVQYHNGARRNTID